MFDQIYIEISNICNLQCSFCPEVLRPKKMMSPENFKKVLHEVQYFTKAITLHVMGEPLAHPQFPEFLNLIEEYSIPLILTSNGLLLERHSTSLLNSKSIKQINFSVHSFLDNFPNKDISTYLFKLADFSKHFISTHPESFVNYRLWNLQSAIDSETSSNKKIFDELRLNFAEPDLPTSVSVESKKSYRLDRHIKLHFDTVFEWPSLNSKSESSNGFCYGLQKQLAILTEGTVVPCCLDKEAVINLGNIFENSLSQILEKERSRNIVNSFKMNIASEPLCKKCQFKNRFTRI